MNYGQLPSGLYTAEQVRALDSIAINQRGVPGIVLMKRAGRTTLDALLARFGQPKKIQVFCGAGNNGGDGYIVAALALQRGIASEIVTVCAPEKLQGDAEQAMIFARQAGVPMAGLDKTEVIADGVIVDALLGTGISGEVRAEMAAVIAMINNAGVPVVAVDIPSGLDSDTGADHGCCIAAQLTVSFIGLKRGLFTGHGPAASGDVVFDDLSVSPDIYSTIVPATRRLDWAPLKKAIRLRPRDAHKGLFGHVMVIGGDLGFGGAVMLAAESALRTGAGMVSVATRPEHVAALLARCPEAMVNGVSSGQALEPLLDRPTILVVGPGLGRTPWSEQMLQKAVATGLPMVMDADALNILSEGRVAADADKSKWVLTPHPGEAARLLGITAQEVQQDRFAAISALRDKYACAVVLKGAGSLMTTTGSLVELCPYGNPGMAVAGMGDVLSGVIGGLLAQGYDRATAMGLGVCLHALAGDDAVAQNGQLGLVASDLMPHLRARLNGE